MKFTPRAVLTIFLCEILLLMPACHKQVQLGAPAPAPAPGLALLQKELQRHYLTLFRIAPKLHFTSSQFAQMQKNLQQGEAYCQGQFNAHTHKYKAEIEHLQKRLQRMGKNHEHGERHVMLCRLQQLRVLESQSKVLAHHAIPVAYENRMAKLELIQQWPAELRETRHEIATGAYRNRRWGDVKDIGFRVIAPGQRDDIKAGREAIQQMKQNGMMPPEVQNKAVVDYVKSVAQKVAAHSDLHVPLHVTVLNSKEINAFALPGGYIFVERGLLQAVDDEAELAGVLGHEIGHVCARHAHKLMKKRTIASIFYQAAQVAALVLTGGIGGIGTYYAMQYGFYGLGMVLNLDLLGVSRKFELQADQLGIQYAWNAGYDPTGFVRFFDKMATKEGYVNGVSWFHTHPPFYARMVDAEREIMFLPKKKRYIINTQAFRNMKKELKKVEATAHKSEKNRPTLYDYGKARGCSTPKEFEFKPNEPIEELCQSPQLVTPAKKANNGSRE